MGWGKSKPNIQDLNSVLAKEESKKGYLFKIAPYYYQYVIDSLEKQYKRQLPCIQVEITKKLEILRDDPNTIEFEFNRDDSEALNEFIQAEALIENSLQEAQTMTDLTFPCWFYTDNGQQKQVPIGK